MPAPVSLIAETDEFGRIAWIWRLGPEDRCARPVAEPAKHLHELGHSRHYGASRDAIYEWIARHSREARHSHDG